MERKGLGRGLSALIPGASEGTVLEIDLNQVALNPWQPRKSMNEGAVRELAASVREHGIIQPIVVRGAGQGKY